MPGFDGVWTLGNSEPNNFPNRLKNQLCFEPKRRRNRLMRYNWQQTDWPEFRYDLMKVSPSLLTFAEHSGRLGGLLEGLPEDFGSEVVIDLMLAEAIKSSAIEGETLEREDVLSSIRNHLGLNPELSPVKSRMAAGAGELMVSIRSTYATPLSEVMLLSWHSMLLDGTPGILFGDWRQHIEPMQVISGRIDKPGVHFEAPPSKAVPAEMGRFIEWFNDTAPGGRTPIPQVLVRSALAHLYFESIHPFEDGNGRIGRAISEKALSQGMGRPAILSLSRTIEASRSAYYHALQSAQSSNEVTAWISYFVETALAAQLDAETQITFVLKKSKFYNRYERQINERQAKVIRRMFEAGPGGRWNQCP
jgi:Fic family protein